MLEKIIQESGASHLKKFVTKCSLVNKKFAKSPSLDEPPTTSDTVAANEQVVSTETTITQIKNIEDLLVPSTDLSLNFETVGEGNSKRLSKKNASIKMLSILKEKLETLFLIARKNDEELINNLAKLEVKPSPEKAVVVAAVQQSGPLQRSCPRCVWMHACIRFQSVCLGAMCMN